MTEDFIDVFQVVFLSLLVITLSATKEIVIFFGTPTDMIFLSPPYIFPDYFSDKIATVIEANDLNGDGFIDLVFSYRLRDLQSNGNVRLFLNTGDGRRFTEKDNDFAFLWFEILSIVIADLDNDGRQNDIALLSAENQIYICFSIFFGDILFDPDCSATSRSAMYAHPSQMVKGRFNDDDLDDLALISSQSDTLQILLPYRIPNHMESIVFNQLIYLTDNYPTSLTRFHFNNDLIDDLAVLNCNGTVSVFLGTKSGLFDRKYLTFGTNADHNGTCCHSLNVADLNQDGKDDLVFIDATMNSIRVILGSSCDE